MQQKELQGLRLTPNQITEAAAWVWQINSADILNNTTDPAIVEPRHVVFYHRVKILGVKASQIAQETGFSFETILRGCNEVSQKLHTDPVLKMRYDLLKAWLKVVQNG